ncbi:hypothetical protein EWM64_g3757 [Hericium alpestre]|uniref:non-specific serine/threonine protein kinase n=1 Tax=Hericium alpestre TaxID=135208 RepID=A0A4Z0A1S4_9AGAM|nr:hypothetical protein EWM64_g3757 [Hericium alpestre]
MSFSIRSVRQHFTNLIANATSRRTHDANASSGSLEHSSLASSSRASSPVFSSECDSVPSSPSASASSLPRTPEVAQLVLPIASQVKGADEWWDGDDVFNPVYTPPPKAPHLSMKDFRVLEPNGIGTYAKVVTAKAVATGRLYCLKVMDKDRVAKKESVRRALTELQACMRMSEHDYSSHLVEALASFEDRTKLFTVMPLYGCDLQTVIDVKLDVKFVKRWSFQAAMGTAALHQMGIVHMDIKPANLLLDHDSNVRIADFGHAYVHPSAPLLREDKSVNIPTDIGTFEYGSQDRWLHGYVNQMTDYWSLGVILCRLASPWANLWPFYDYEDYVQYCQDESVNTVEYWYSNFWVDEDLAPVLSGLLHTDPNMRWDLGDLAKCKYYEEQVRQELELEERIALVGNGVMPYLNGTIPYATYDDPSIEYRPDEANPEYESEVRGGWTESDSEILGDFRWINPRGPWKDWNFVSPDTESG